MGSVLGFGTFDFGRIRYSAWSYGWVMVAYMDVWMGWMIGRYPGGFSDFVASCWFALHWLGEMWIMSICDGLGWR